MTRRSQVALAVLLLLCHPAAHADDHALAHQLADEAKALVKRGEFRPGVEKLWAAYSADPDPHILFNLGVTYEVLARAGGADDIRHGIDCFERFVKALPNSPHRAKAEAALARLRALAPTNVPTPPPAPVVPAKPPAPPSKTTPHRAPSTRKARPPCYRAASLMAVSAG